MRNYGHYYLQHGPTWGWTNVKVWASGAELHRVLLSGATVQSNRTITCSALDAFPAACSTQLGLFIFLFLFLTIDNNTLFCSNKQAAGVGRQQSAYLLDAPRLSPTVS